jgi:hypothetical protein
MEEAKTEQKSLPLLAPLIPFNQLGLEATIGPKDVGFDTSWRL